MLHRRQLPVISPCDDFAGREATDDAPAWCTHCTKHVHDLSRLREDEVLALVTRSGGDLCVSYRTRADGSIELRPPRRPLVPAVLAIALAGCAGHLGELEPMASDCVDASGVEMPCPPWAAHGGPTIPDAFASDEVAAGAPVRPDLLAPPDDDAPVAVADVDAPIDRVAIDPVDGGPTEDSTTVAEEPAPCVVTPAMRRAAENERRFVRGKLAPLTDALICASDRAQRAEGRRQRRSAR